MFWRRKTSGASSSSSNSSSKRQKHSGDNAGGGDEIAQLQRQFGIKPVSDADVQAEFRSLFGAGAAATGGASGLSPRSELLLFGASGNSGDDDEEVAILRALNIHGTSVDKIDVDALYLSDDDDDNDDANTMVSDGGAAKRELASVLRDAHATAAQSQSQSDPMQIAANAQPTGGARSLDDDVAARVRELKLEAIAHKREGNVKEALALFRQAKELEAQAAAAPPQPVRAAPVAPPAVARTASLKAPAAVDTSALDVDDADVQVTDEDMKDPAYLAQLAALGLAPDDEDDASAPVDTVALLTAELQDTKLQALRHKRSNEIQDALQCMRRVKELEAKLAALSASAAGADSVPHVSTSTVVTTVTAVAHTSSSARQPAGAAVVDRQTRSSAVEVVHAYTSAATTPGDDDEDGDVDVTDADMDDPAFAAELATLGFAPSASDSSASRQASLEDAQSAETRLERAQTAESVWSAGGASGRALQSALSTGDEDLIDAFEDSDDDDQSTGARSAIAPSRGYGVLAAEAAPSVPLPPVPAAPAAPDSRAIADLEAQLQLAKETAVRLKRSGDIQGALDAMRRIKQIESLLAHKQQQQGAASVPSALAPPPVRHDPATQAQFQALEQLLVDFGNRALALAKEHLSIDRAKATEWLNKRKEYASALDELREKRKDPLQAPPPYRIEHLMRQVDVELTDVPVDHVVVVIHGVNDLRTAAGRDVVVRFCLNFPAATPHEGKTSAVRVSSTPPHSTSTGTRPQQFQFPVQRSRGTQRLFEIKKAQFEVWTVGTFLRSAELLARGYQELTPFLSTCQVHTRVPFVGSNRKPTGGDVEVSIRLRTPLRDKETRTEIVEELHVGAYPAPSVPVVTPFAPLVATLPPPPAPRPVAPAGPARVPSAVDVTLPPPPRVASAVASSSEPTDDEMDDPHHPDLIISYDVINEEIAKIEAKLPALQGPVAMELRDRLDSLALKKQLLEIDMETGKLTLEMYVAKLHARIQADRQLMAKLMRASRRLDAARVLHRVKTMEKELVGTDDSAGSDSGAPAPI